MKTGIKFIKLFFYVKYHYEKLETDCNIIAWRVMQLYEEQLERNASNFFLRKCNCNDSET
jgi:hypothetical protein